MLDPKLIIDAGMDDASARAMVEEAARAPAGRLHEFEVQAGLRERVMTRVPRCASLNEALRQVLIRPPHFCVVRGTGFLEIPEESQTPYLVALSSLLGRVSQDNRFSERSGMVADEVRPIDPSGTDVTYTLGACEVHTDESSKPRPEDVVTLWCLRPARDGGASLVWSVRDVMATLAAQAGGQEVLAFLRSHRFPFGGKLRQPPRVLLAPILFGEDGVRFRLGAIRDAFEVLSREPSALERAALQALSAAIERTPPYEYSLARGEMLVLLNRRVLHGRTAFLDTTRLLLRTRCFQEALSNSHEDVHVGWLGAS